MGVSPMIWRRLQVPPETTLRELHGTLQVAMGWEGLHLYQAQSQQLCHEPPHGGVRGPGGQDPEPAAAELPITVQNRGSVAVVSA